MSVATINRIQPMEISGVCRDLANVAAYRKHCTFMQCLLDGSAPSEEGSVPSLKAQCCTIVQTHPTLLTQRAVKALTFDAQDRLLDACTEMHSVVTCANLFHRTVVNAHFERRIMNAAHSDRCCDFCQKLFPQMGEKEDMTRIFVNAFFQSYEYHFAIINPIVEKEHSMRAILFTHMRTIVDPKNWTGKVVNFMLPKPLSMEKKYDKNNPYGRLQEKSSLRGSERGQDVGANSQPIRYTPCPSMQMEENAA